MPSDKRTAFLRALLALCREHDVELCGEDGYRIRAEFRSGEAIADVEIDTDVARGTWGNQSHAVVL